MCLYLLSANNSLTIKMNTDYDSIKYLFPAGTKIINFAGSEDKYTALLRSKYKSKEEFRENWLSQYEKLSGVTMRVLLTRPKTGKTVVYKAVFRCQHNTYPGSHQRVKMPHKKHTGCPAILRVTIKASPENRRVRSNDALRKEYPTIIVIKHEHNHLLLNKINFFTGCIKTCEKTMTRLTNINSETFTNALINSEYKKNELGEPDWNFLKDFWSSFLDRCESSNSVHLYRALLKATNCLENCKTVSAIISALNSVGQKPKQKRCDAEGLTGSIMQRKQWWDELNSNSAKFSIIEVSNAVDELLVIDQGLIK